MIRGVSWVLVPRFSGGNEIVVAMSLNSGTEKKTESHWREREREKMVMAMVTMRGRGSADVGRARFCSFACGEIEPTKERETGILQGMMMMISI